MGLSADVEHLVRHLKRMEMRTGRVAVALKVEIIPTDDKQLIFDLLCERLNRTLEVQFVNSSAGIRRLLTVEFDKADS